MSFFLFLFILLIVSPLQIPSSLFFLGLQSSRLFFLLVSISPCSHSICDKTVLVNAPCVSSLLSRPSSSHFFSSPLYDNLCPPLILYIRTIDTRINEHFLQLPTTKACTCMPSRLFPCSKPVDSRGDVTVRSWVRLCLARKCSNRL